MFVMNKTDRSENLKISCYTIWGNVMLTLNLLTVTHNLTGTGSTFNSMRVGLSLHTKLDLEQLAQSCCNTNQ